MELESYFMPYTFIGLEHGIPLFSLRDINLYGTPDLFGIEEYLVIDDPTESCPFVLDYKVIVTRRICWRSVAMTTSYPTNEQLETFC